MLDPESQLATRFGAAIGAAFGAEHAGVDPAIRRSSHADYQADVAMSLARTLKKKPREIAQALIDNVDLEGIAEKLEIAGPGFVNVRLSRDYLERLLLEAAADSAPAYRQPSTPNGGDRLLGAERGQGDARRQSAVDDHRRRAGADARVRRAPPHPREPHRRLGPAVRDADRAPARPRQRQRGISDLARSTSKPREVRRRRLCRALAQAR
jgi:hypothetical protein